MALVDCPECGDRVSTISPQCPNCGHVLSELSEEAVAIQQDPEVIAAARRPVTPPAPATSAPPRSQSNWVVAAVVAAIVGAILAVVAAAVILAGSVTIENPFEDSDSTGAAGQTTIVETTVVVDAPSDYGLAVGECIDDSEMEHYFEGDDYTTTSCDGPHDNEVYYLHEYLPGPFPGEDAVSEELEDVCRGEFEIYVAHDYESSSLAIYRLWPGPDLWESGERIGECLLYDGDQDPLIGSAYQSGW